MHPIKCTLLLALTGSVVSFTTTRPSQSQVTSLFSTAGPDIVSTPTELPDSMEDGAEIAANACSKFAEATGGMGRCRITFDTSAGDETYTILKTSSEFMQNFVSYTCYQMIPGLQQIKQGEMMKVAQARAELQAILDQEEAGDAEGIDQEKKAQCIQILENGGRDPDFKWEGPNVRIYFPDEGSAALARRDWLGNSPAEAKVPPCVAFASTGSAQIMDVSKDEIIFFFCPKAPESEDVEALLLKTETTSTNLKLSVFVNPNLVDMGVTGFGMVGRQLRERLLDGLVDTYYLRTLPWGALTRVWPNAHSVWQEDDDAVGGYKLIKSQNYLPSNPEVEDIYDIANGLMDERQSIGVLDQLGDFVNGMMRL